MVTCIWITVSWPSLAVCVLAIICAVHAIGRGDEGRQGRNLDSTLINGERDCWKYRGDVEGRQLRFARCPDGEVHIQECWVKMQAFHKTRSSREYGGLSRLVHE